MKNLGKYPAKEKAVTKFGVKYEVFMDLQGPNGKTAKVLTGWIKDFGINIPRLTSIYIDKR